MFPLKWIAVPSKVPQHRTTDVTIKDLALQLGISHATVSRALNDHPATSRETKTKVRNLATRLGYIRNAGPAIMRGTHSKLIGFIAPDVQNDFYSTVATVLAESCGREGFQLVLAISDDDPELELKHVMALREARAAGLVLTPTLNIDNRTVELIGPMPAVQLVRSSHALKTRSVVIDDRLGTRLGATHLIELGHRRIGFVGGTKGLSTSAERLKGVEDAHKQAGLRMDPTLIELGAPRPAFGRDALARLMARPNPPTGIVLGSSQLTLGAIATLHEKRISVPKDLSIVGYGDPPWFQYWNGGVTTVGLPTDEVAAAAISSLFRRMRALDRSDDIQSASPGAGPVQYSPQLIVRGTTVAPAPRRLKNSK